MRTYRIDLDQTRRELLWSALSHVNHDFVCQHDFKQIEARLREETVELTAHEMHIMLDALNAYIEYAEVNSDDWLRIQEHQVARRQITNLMQKAIWKVQVPELKAQLLNDRPRN